VPQLLTKNKVFIVSILFIFLIGVHGVLAQERDKDSESKGTHTSETLEEAEGKFDEAKNYFDSILGWIGNKLKFFTDKIDAAVGADKDNKGTNALFGLPLYILVAIFGLFALKLVFNIFRDILKALFSGDGGKPKGRHRR